MAQCVRAALLAMSHNGIVGEVIVADNGSTDGSIDLATAAGARVVNVPERGYGAALLGGLAAARGEIVLMADADATYDLGQLPGFYNAARQGADFIMGTRYPGRVAVLVWTGHRSAGEAGYKRQRQ